MTRSRWQGRSAAFVLTAAIVAGCGGGGSTPTLGPGGRSSGGPVPGTVGPPGATGGAAPSDTGFGFNFSLPPQPTWPPSGGKVRVVNIYDPLIESPFPIDVVQSGFGGASAPLLTVQPGAATDYFDPGDSGDGSASLAFYRSGSTKSDDNVMQQGWNNMKGRQVTIVIFNSGTQQTDPNDPSATLTERALTAAYVVEEHGGTNPRPTPEAGKGTLWIDTQPMNEIPFGKGWGAPAIGTGDGTCLLALGDSGPAGYSFIQGQQGFSLPPGQASLNVYDPISNPDQCKGTPVFGPIRATIESGNESVVLIYGFDAQHLNTLVLPIGR